MSFALRATITFLVYVSASAIAYACNPTQFYSVEKIQSNIAYRASLLKILSAEQIRKLKREQNLSIIGSDFDLTWSDGQIEQARTRVLSVLQFNESFDRAETLHKTYFQTDAYVECVRHSHGDYGLYLWTEQVTDTTVMVKGRYASTGGRRERVRPSSILVQGVSPTQRSAVRQAITSRSWGPHVTQLSIPVVRNANQDFSLAFSVGATAASVLVPAAPQVAPEIKTQAVARFNYTRPGTIRPDNNGWDIDESGRTIVRTNPFRFGSLITRITAPTGYPYDRQDMPIQEVIVKDNRIEYQLRIDPARNPQSRVFDVVFDVYYLE